MCTGSSVHNMSGKDIPAPNPPPLFFGWIMKGLALSEWALKLISLLQKSGNLVAVTCSSLWSRKSMQNIITWKGPCLWYPRGSSEFIESRPGGVDMPVSASSQCSRCHNKRKGHHPKVRYCHLGAAKDLLQEHVWKMGQMKRDIWTIWSPLNVYRVASRRHGFFH